MTHTGHILLVDDDPSLRHLLALRLKGADHEVTTAQDGPSALQALHTAPVDCVITDLRMDGMDGIELLTQLQRKWPSLPVILLTAHGSIPDAVSATQKGAIDFLTKPVDSQALLDSVDQALSRRAPASAVPDTIRQTQDFSRSPVMHRLLADIRQTADTNTHVLIEGEFGTGKQTLMRALHDSSPRQDAPFTVVNCDSRLTHELDVELFGHDATADGRIPAADGGTVYLDGIDGMPLVVQEKLLHVLESRSVRTTDGDSTPVDVRFVAATRRDMSPMLDEGLFRQDLYYRLAVVNLHVPPLRERIEDIVPLCQHFLLHLDASETDPMQTRVLAPEAVEILVRHDWPGNIQQLANTMEQSAALSPGPVITAQTIEQVLKTQGGEINLTLPSLAEARDSFIRDYLIQLLQVADGKVSRAAQLAQRNRTEFYKLLSRHDIDPAVFKKGRKND